MPKVSVTATVRKDWSLSIPRKAREELHLREGDHVKLTVERAQASDAEIDEAMLSIIGVAEGGQEDGAENHDKYLFGREYQ
jgi:bifunctional DNA-binding transcriptional regulator/antitoxin component of YhaV-PrlF toxin-antitoxin module